jgi:hypothetical protein
MSLFRFLFLGELGTCPQNFMPTRGVEPWEIHKFSQGVYGIQIQRLVFDNKNSIWKILGLKIQTMETCSSASSMHRDFNFWKILKSPFLVEIQSSVSWQIWADFSSFGQFWAEFATLIVDESLPEARLKSLKPHNS